MDSNVLKYWNDQMWQTPMTAQDDDRQSNIEKWRRIRTRLATVFSGKRSLVVGGCLLLLVFFALALLRNNQSSTTSPANDSQITPSPLADVSLYADPLSNAARQADTWQIDRPEDAAAMSKLATQPAAKWVTSTAGIDQALETYLSGADQAGETALLVAYNIPNRDCGLYSAGGASDLTSYQAYIDSLVTTIGNRSAIVILEPDALPNINANGKDGKACLTAGQRQEQYAAFNYAIQKLASLGKTVVYIDAGNSAWVKDISKLAETLRKAGVSGADGFSLNVSNFQTNAKTISYGRKLAEQLDGKHFVVDTSRNGLGAYRNPAYPDFSWCNPPGRALGHYPTVSTSESLVDAYLYIKSPGESDGKDPDPKKCFDGPQAGEWRPDYALGLVERWPNNLQPR